MADHIDNKIKTPGGLTIGIRHFGPDGQVMMSYKLGEHYDDVTPEQIVECITGCHVQKIIGSIIFFVGLTLPRYRFSKPSASLDMNLRQCVG